jgi:hypothetical protein
MSSETVKLTVRLPREDVEYVKAYARDHGMTVTEVIDRYLRRMRAADERSPSPELEVITGLVPKNVDADAEYRRHIWEKHGG